jgi:hypothetical protein
MPQVVRDVIASEQLLFEAEGVRVTRHRSGRVPGGYSSASVNAWLGSFAVTDQRVIGCRGKVKWVDMPFAMRADGPAGLTLDEGGLHVVFDLDDVHPSCRGEMRLDFRAAIPRDVLARFPATELRFAVDPQRVVRLWGSRSKLPD